MVPVSFYEKWHQMKSTRFLWKIVHVIGKVYGAIVWIINLSPIYSWWNLYRVFLKLGEVQGDQTQTVYFLTQILIVRNPYLRTTNNIRIFFNGGISDFLNTLRWLKIDDWIWCSLALIAYLGDCGLGDWIGII